MGLEYSQILDKMLAEFKELNKTQSAILSKITQDYSNEERNKRCEFAVYFDVPNPHVTIHKIGIHVLEINGGEHKIKDVSGWGYFVSEHEAKSFAEGISKSKHVPMKYCRTCYKN